MQQPAPFPQLCAAWKKAGGGVPPMFFDFVPIWIERALEGREVQYATEIEVDGNPRVLVIADNKAHLLHVTEQVTSLETVFLGALQGGKYREIIGDTLRLEFSHPRLGKDNKVVVEGPADGADVKAVRALFRTWAETRPGDEPNVS
jgi:hypothetical protein